MTQVLEATVASPATVWEADPAHSSVEFVVGHLMGKVRGRFDEFAAEISMGDKPEEARVTGNVKTASINTNQTARDSHLTSPDFFDAPTYPELTFTSTSIEAKDTNEYVMRGNLTIRDKTLPVEFDVEFLGSGKDAYGNDRLGFAATAEIDRFDFGLTWDGAVAMGNLVVARKVKLDINLQFLERKGA